MAKPYVEVEVRGKRILRIDAPFDEALQSLRREGVKNPITSEELAYARTYHPEGKQSVLMTRGSYTRAGFAYMKGENPIRAPDSPLLNMSLAKQATQANRNNQYFATKNEKRYEQLAKLAKEDKSKEPEKRRAIVLPSRSNFQISSTKNPEVFANIFGRAGQEYLDFLGFNSMTVYPVAEGVVDAQLGTILTQEWLARLGDDSDVGGLRCLGYASPVRGVQLVTGEASSQKTKKAVLPYTTQDLRNAEREITRLSEILQPKQFASIKGLLGKLRGN